MIFSYHVLLFLSDGDYFWPLSSKDATQIILVRFLPLGTASTLQRRGKGGLIYQNKYTRVTMFQYRLGPRGGRVSFRSLA